MNDLTIIKRDGAAYIDSRDVAEAIGKNHKDLLRDIRGYAKIIEKISERNFAPVDFFLESSYTDSKGETRPCFLISKRGCELCTIKLTGEKGVMFTTTYVSKFNEMEKAEREAETKSHSRPCLNEFNYAVRNVLNGMSLSHQKPARVMKFLQGVYEKLGVEVLPFCEDDCFGYYSVTEIAAEIGVYSENNRPHSHAISAIIQKIDDHTKHAMVVPYGLVGAMVRYDWYIVMQVMDWFTENKYPAEIPYLGFKYHVHYKVEEKAGKDDLIDLCGDGFTLDELYETREKCGKYDKCPSLYGCSYVD